MLGFFDYTMWLTCAGMACAVVGISLAVDGQPTWAVACLMLAGFCDSVDGMVARTKKDRTAEERYFGAQLDSLCDIVSFGVLPAVLCYTLGVRGVVGNLVLAFYCVCGVIRLAWFNMLEACRTPENNPKRHYHGLPITFISAILPLVYLLRVWMPDAPFALALYGMLLVIAGLYILDFPVPRTKPVVGASLMLIDIAALMVCLMSGV
ncbi:MAG TPA: CDP-alcohol phosphatidyltransferase family protein [Candidatus Limiplasma stercoravium]|nr:CDP-alcohol phosphatidyltransferase family protein [Candidatus Limiplasma stercoravium]